MSTNKDNNGESERDREPTETEAVPSGGWRAVCEAYGVDTSIEPAEECDQPSCNERDDLDFCVILGGEEPEVRVTCPTHRTDTLEVST